jgi:hypothetical protein
VALAMGGYGLLGAILGVLFLLGVAPHLGSVARLGPPRRMRFPRWRATSKTRSSASSAVPFALRARGCVISSRAGG